MIELTQRFLGVYVNERTADSLPNAQTNPTAQSCKRPIKSFYLENYQDSQRHRLLHGVLAAALLPRVFRPVSAPASSFPVPSPCFAPPFCGSLCSFAFLGWG